MSTIASRWKIMVLAAAVLCIAAGAFHFRGAFADAATPGAPLGADGQLHPDTALKYWTARIKQVGGDKAYQEFLAAYAHTPYDTQHAAAHLIGHVLYQTLGIEGLPVCDSSFSFGCYHQFFIDALTANGLSIVPKLDAACVAKYGPMGTGCQHGIGHGLGEYFGYTEDALMKELKSCSMTTQVNDYFGCTSGVFMQYFEPIELSGNVVETDLHPFDASDPLAPCDTFVPGEYKAVCYYSLPQWWHGLNPQSGYRQIGLYCASAPAAYRESCYKGIGSIAAPGANYDVAGTIANCEEIPDATGKILCRASASWAEFSMPDRRTYAAAICEGLPSQELHLCVQQSDLLGDGEIFKAEQKN